MYIGVKDQKIVFIQMEMGDFTNSSTKKYFNLEEKEDFRRIKQLLNPKRAQRAQRKARRSKNQKTDENFKPVFLKVQTKANRAITLTRTSSQDKKKSQENKIKQSNKTMPTTNFAACHRDLRFFTNSEIKSKSNVKKTSKKEPKKTPKKESKKSAEKYPKITNETIEKFGHTGDLPISCPNCGDDLRFFPEDLDSIQLHSTRLCDCGTIVRISTREYYRKIFNNLFTQAFQDDLDLNITPTAIYDNAGNQVYCYGLKLPQN
ncbi:MAG: hypothetical protein ACTSWC_13215 [Promethearchaeota archaeon]